MIKAIIFDCFGVLTSGTWQQFWSSLPTESQQHKVRALNKSYDTGLISQAEFSQQLQAVTGLTAKEIEAKVFNDNLQKNEELLTYIKSLKSKYKLSILSNIASNWVRESLLTKAEQALFVDMLFSYEVKLAKPDPKIFKLACQRLDVKLSEAILIDDLERYCVVAEQLGMKAVVYKNFGQMKRELEGLLANVRS